MVELLRSGGVILLPTDTIYGLHAVGADQRGVARVAKIKGRDEDKRFITLAGTIEQLETLGADVPGVLREIWPAPLTAILRHGQSTLAARVPDLAWLRLMIERTGPLISTSANRSGEPPITSPADLDLKLLKEIDGVADAGRREGKASPIVDFTQTEPRFIREGDPGFTQMLRKRLLKKL
jgi:tRNA threonylcarbamoyl adenosine modification protein (Sua5/YciO/YrdC/YwlC family)